MGLGPNLDTGCHYLLRRKDLQVDANKIYYVMCIYKSDNGARVYHLLPELEPGTRDPYHGPWLALEDCVICSGEVLPWRGSDETVS